MRFDTKLEKELIKKYGGKPNESYGPDGEINGRPTEVRVAKTEDRFRLNKETHKELVEEGGSYIFSDIKDNQPSTKVPARRVDDKIEDKIEDGWYSDRGYKHTFLDVDSIF